MLESPSGAFALPNGLLELRDALEAEWPTRQESLRESGAFLNDGEADDGASGADDSVDDAVAAAADEVDSGDDAVAPTVTPTEPALNPLELQAELEHMRSQNAELYSILEQFSGRAEGQEPTAAQAADPQFTDEYGNFDSKAFADYISQQNQNLLQQVSGLLNPLQQTFQQQQEASVIAEGEQRLADILADDVSRNGEFASDAEADAKAREMVSTLASQIFPDIAERYGTNPKSAEIAMSRAATEVRSLLRSVGGAAVSQTQNQLATLAEQRGEPGAHGAGVEAPVIRIGETSAQRFAT